MTESGTSFSIINHSDNDRVFKFENIPSSVKTIMVDNENEVITSSGNFNPYENFNLNFLRLVRGYNRLKFVGNAEVSFECEYPINVGG